MPSLFNLSFFQSCKFLSILEKTQLCFLMRLRFAISVVFLQTNRKNLFPAKYKKFTNLFSAESKNIQNVYFAKDTFSSLSKKPQTEL
jgi:hypothetical protein